MIHSKLFLMLLTVILLSGCNLVYKQSVQQGNAIEQDSVDDLTIGMSKRQVSLIMGTPAVADPFHSDRWDYVYTFRPRGSDGSQRNITLFFEDSALLRIDDKGFRKTGDDSPVVIAETTGDTQTEAPVAVTEDTVPPETVATPVITASFEEAELTAEPAEVVIEQVEDVSGDTQEFEPTSTSQQGTYSVQLGSFTDMDNAAILRDVVVNAGHEAIIDTLSDQSPVRYRVRSGDLPSRADADSLVETLETDTGHYGFVIRVDEATD